MIPNYTCSSSDESNDPASDADSESSVCTADVTDLFSGAISNPATVDKLFTRSMRTFQSRASDDTRFKRLFGAAFAASCEHVASPKRRATQVIASRPTRTHSCDMSQSGDDSDMHTPGRPASPPRGSQRHGRNTAVMNCTPDNPSDGHESDSSSGSSTHSSTDTQPSTDSLPQH